MGYFEEIKNERLREITKRQVDFVDETYKYYFLGEYKKGKKAVRDFWESLYRSLLQDEEYKRRTFLVNKTFDKQFKCEEIEMIIEKVKRFKYFTPSVFWHHKSRTKEELIWITSITLDFDFKKDGSEREFNPQQLAYIIKQELGLLPNRVWETKTKGNFQVNFIMNPMTGTPKSILFYESITKRLAVLLGADVVATTSSNLYSVPQHGYWEFTNEIYDISDFEWVLDDDDLNAALEKKQKERVISLTEKQVMRHPAIQSLLNVEFDCYRNNAAFTIALLFYALGKDSDEAFEFLNGEWFEKVNTLSSKRFLKREVKSTVKSAYSGKYAGPSKEWIYLITGIDFNLNIFRTSYIKGSGKTGRVNLSADETRAKIVDYLREHKEVTMKQPEMAKMLDVPQRSLEKEIAYLKEHGVIETKSQRGRYSKGTTFKYVYEGLKAESETEFITVIERDDTYNLENLIEYEFEKTV